jgi:hypothetical protein
MARVRLDAEWTGPDGVTHAAGDTVDVDAETLARLRELGVVREPSPASVDADINDTDL